VACDPVVEGDAGRGVCAVPIPAAGELLAELCRPDALDEPADPTVPPDAMGRGGAFAAGGGEAGGAGRAGGTVGMDVGRGIGFGAVAAVRVGAAASVGAAGRFAAVEGTDVGFTAAMGRAALGAAAELAGRAVAAAVPAADAAEPALAGVEMGFVVAVAARGAPLTDVGCDGIGFGVAAEDDENVGAWLVAAAADDVGVPGDGPAAPGDDAADDDDAAAADVTGLRDVAIALAADAAGADEAAGAGVEAATDDDGDAGVAVDAGVTAAVDEDAGADVVAPAGVGAAAGASPDAKSAGSIIGANHVPEYAESAGAVAQEPVAAVSTCAEARGGASAAVAAFTAFLEPVVAVSVVGAFRAFLEPLALLAESAPIPIRTPLGESATVGAVLFGAPALEVRGAGPDADALGAGLAVLTEARPGVLGAADLLLWPVEAGRTGGIPKPAGEGELWASEAGATFVGGAAGAGTALGALAAVAEPFAVPCAGCTSLAAAAAPEIVPSSGSSVDSNWSNPSKSSESDSYDGPAAADVPGIPAAAASLSASARRSGSPIPSRLSGSISSSPSSSGPACRDSGCAGPPDDDGVVPTGTLPSMGASTGRSVSGSKTGRDAASIISSLVDAASNANLPSTERAQPRSLAGSRFRSL
jgi:hypothetical protein